MLSFSSAMGCCVVCFSSTECRQKGLDAVAFCGCDREDISSCTILFDVAWRKVAEWLEILGEL